MEENLNPLNQLKAMEPEPEKTIRYTIDLTRNYHNLLEREENQRSQIYLWDGNAAGFYDEGKESPQYYLQDELGSPLRIEGEDGRLRESYGYDEFGRDLYGNQGKVQPFGYTGYQHDIVAGTYFAQAREYERESGRFLSQDLIAGFADMPFSMNKYIYCFDNGMMLADYDGEWPTIVVGAAIGFGIGVIGSMISQRAQGKKISLSDTLIDGISGAAAGAIAGSGVGIVAGASGLSVGVGVGSQFAARAVGGAAIGAANYVAKTSVHNEWNKKSARKHLEDGLWSSAEWAVSTIASGSATDEAIRILNSAKPIEVLIAFKNGMVTREFVEGFFLAYSSSLKEYTFSNLIRTSFVGVLDTAYQYIKYKCDEGD